MSDEDTKTEIIKGGVEIAKTAYRDALQPIAKETGKALGTLGKTVNVALSPLAGLVWGYEQFQEFLETKVAAKLNEVDPDEIVTPKSVVAIPTLEALRYSGDEEELSNLYAGLLATAMTKSLADKAHPAFTGIIKSLSPDEAKILSQFKGKNSHPVVDIRTKLNIEKVGFPEEVKISPTAFFLAETNISLLGVLADCDYPNQAPVYLDNLTRLGLVSFPSDHTLSQQAYTELEESDVVKEARQHAEQNGIFISFLKRRKVDITSFGTQFLLACTKD